MKDIDKLLKKYYFDNGNEKYVMGEKWKTSHHKEYYTVRSQQKRWKMFLEQMNIIRNENPEIRLTTKTRQLAKDIVYNLSYNGNLGINRINFIIIFYIFNVLYNHDYDFSKYMNELDLNKITIYKFIKKYIDESIDIIKGVYGDD